MALDALAVAWRKAVPVPPTRRQFAEFASVIGWLPDPSLPDFPVPLPMPDGPAD